MVGHTPVNPTFTRLQVLGLLQDPVPKDKGLFQRQTLLLLSI